MIAFWNNGYFSIWHARPSTSSKRLTMVSCRYLMRRLITVVPWFSHQHGWFFNGCSKPFTVFDLRIIIAWWFGTVFFHILGIITPTDEHIFERGRSTTSQIRKCQVCTSSWLTVHRYRKSLFRSSIVPT